MNRTQLFLDGWQFWHDDTVETELPGGPLAWQDVTLPHDWQIWHVDDLYQDGTGWYRKRFSLGMEPGVRYALYFEGVYMDVTLFVNGAVAGEWKYGYSSFHYDITDFLRSGENEILVRCVLWHPNSRWYSGAGIYRDVWLWEMPETHLLPHSLYIAPQEGAEETWRLPVCAQVGRSGAGPVDRAEYAVAFSVCDAQGRELTRAVVPQTAARPLDAGETEPYARGEREICAYEAELTLRAPRLWDPSDPYCYRVRAVLLRDGEETDCLDSTFGCRTVELDPARGLLLNHRELTLHGVCLHHDLGCLGAAFSRSAAERQIQIMLEMGANAIRTAHNMPAPAVMELADQYGVLIVSESFDCWRLQKNPYDYARFFPDWYRRDVASWVRRDRNHPSLLMWSIGNEIYDTHAGPEGAETMCALMDEVRRHDPYGNGAVTLGSNYMAWENTQRCADIIKVIGYNYSERLYAAHHAAHPDWVIYGSETASIVQSRGIYHFPLEQSLLVDDDLQCSSLGNSSTSWGAHNVDECLRADEENPFTLGQFIWSGFDYLGEPTPYHTKNSYLGQVDTAGFPKDSFYLYQAGWTDWRTAPMVHVFPYWDFNPGQQIDVCVCSNAPEVELWVNGVSQGRRALTESRMASWKVPYQPGSLCAAAYAPDGREIARDETFSFGDAAALTLRADRAALTQDRELAFLTVGAVDADGRPVENASNKVTVRVTGPGRLMGLDNGDSTDREEYKCDARRLFSGKLLAVVAGTGAPGTIEVEVTSPGLLPARCRVDVLPGLLQAADVCSLSAGRDREEIPVRKLELTAARRTLDPACPSVEIFARRCPPEAAEGELVWRLTDCRGVDVSNAALEPLAGDASRVRVTGLGDGEVRVRCAVRQGEVLAPISVLELNVEGMGSRYLSPYDSLSASLYTRSGGEVTNGNERGIATSRDGNTWVAYENLDFGRGGSDEVTMPIFELAGDPLHITFWQGVPHEAGSEVIGERVYHKPTRWNVYQEETFHLDRKLTGVQTFGFELEFKAHIKGFQFRPQSRAWDRLPVTGADVLYGDSYERLDEAIVAIGNNVSLVFREMDFGTRGFHSLTVWGRTELDHNTIHIRFQRDGKEERRSVEFACQEDWGPQTFPLEPVYGMQEVTFIFLPGSNFDFESFQFQ